VPSISTMLITLVLNSDLAEMRDDVLHLCIRTTALSTSKVVQPRKLVKEIIDDGNDDRNRNRVSPNNDDSDNGSVAILGEVGSLVDRMGQLSSTATEPAEDAEKRGKDINCKDGEDELIRGIGLSSTGDEDEPILGERGLKEEYALDGAEVLNEAAVGKEHCTTHDPGTESQKST